jgi:hypothetical protein
VTSPLRQQRARSPSGTGRAQFQPRTPIDKHQIALMHNQSDQRAALNVAATNNTLVDPTNNTITYSLADMAPLGEVGEESGEDGFGCRKLGE